MNTIKESFNNDIPNNMKIHPKKLYYLELNGNFFTYNYNSLNKQNNTIIDLIFKCKDCLTYNFF